MVQVVRASCLSCPKTKTGKPPKVVIKHITEIVEQKYVDRVCGVDAKGHKVCTFVAKGKIVLAKK